MGLQGMPLASYNWEDYSDKELIDLAGNSFNMLCLVVLYMAVFATLPMVCAHTPSRRPIMVATLLMRPLIAEA